MNILLLRRCLGVSLLNDSSSGESSSENEVIRITDDPDAIVRVKYIKKLDTGLQNDNGIDTNTVALDLDMTLDVEWDSSSNGILCYANQTGFPIKSFTLYRDTIYVGNTNSLRASNVPQQGRYRITTSFTEKGSGRGTVFLEIVEQTDGEPGYAQDVVIYSGTKTFTKNANIPNQGTVIVLPGNSYNNKLYSITIKNKQFVPVRKGNKAYLYNVTDQTLCPSAETSTYEIGDDIEIIE